jgi:ATP-dependent Clp protease ATP-binding subunit ClpA
MGARPMARVIQENIKKPLADELLFGKLAKGGHIRILADGDKLRFEITKAEEPVAG